MHRSKTYVKSENKGVEPILSHKNIENNRPQTGKEQIIYVSLSDIDQNVILSTGTIQIAKNAISFLLISPDMNSRSCQVSKTTQYVIYNPPMEVLLYLI